MMPDAYLPSPWAPLGALAALHEARRHRHDGAPAAVRAPGPRRRALGDGRRALRRAPEARRRPRQLPAGVRALRPQPEEAGLALRGGDRDPAAAVGGRDARPRGQALQGQGQHHAAPAERRAVDGRDVRARHPPRRPLRLPVADRPAAQHRGHEGVEGHLRRRRRGVRHVREAADGAPARRLGRGLDGRRRARLVAVHPRRALVLLLPDPALGARPRAVPAGRDLARRTSCSTSTASTA